MAGNNIVHLRPSSQQGNNPEQKWIGRIAIFELKNKTRIQGKILGMNEIWIDTDNGAIKVEEIVFAKWVTPEEAQIIRGGPIQPWNGPTFTR